MNKNMSAAGITAEGLSAPSRTPGFDSADLESHFPTHRSRMLLVRHPEVDRVYHGVCYGQSDVALSLKGRQSCDSIAEMVAGWPVAHVVHTGLQRTRMLAEAIGRRVGIQPMQEGSLRERNFGSWELRTWDDIYRDCGDDILKMVTDPRRFRPGGGETTDEFAARVCDGARMWMRTTLTVVVAHGGTIAALLGRQKSQPVSKWANLIPACGEMVWYEPSIPQPMHGSRV